MRFGAIELHEPDKALVPADFATASHRSASVIALDWADMRVYRGIVDLNKLTVARWDSLPARNRPMMLLVIRRLEEAVAGDGRWLTALRRHGFTDPTSVAIFGVPGDTSESVGCLPLHLCVAAWVNVRDAPPPANEIPGLIAHVDLTSGRLLKLDDRGPVALPRIDSDSRRALDRADAMKGGRRSDLGNAGVHVRAGEIRWGPWRMHAGVHPRRGLELWHVDIEDEGKWRSVLYRASLVDMVAPYGDPTFGSFNPNDEKAFGLATYGRNSLVEGGDVPIGAQFVDAVVPDDFGRPVVVPRALAVYEITDGVLWRHAGDARLARRLVLSSVATIDNYDYAFSWIFSADGSIDVDVRLTGVMNVGHSELSRDSVSTRMVHSDHSHLVAAHVYAPNHQHFFSYRLDFDIDSAAGNRVVESNTEADPAGPNNPRGEWFTMGSQVLRTELGARRMQNAASSRRWRVENPYVLNSLGQPVAYSLLPSENALPYAAPASDVRIRQPYLDAQLWVTPYSPDEMYPAGTGPRSGPPFDDIAGWTQRDRSVENSDVVLWYTLGVTHIPRPEDYPFMAAYRTGFRLVPMGFFARNPALGAAKPLSADRAGPPL